MSCLVLTGSQINNYQTNTQFNCDQTPQFYYKLNHPIAKKLKSEIFWEIFNHMTANQPAAKLNITTDQCNEFKQIFSTIAQMLNKKFKNETPEINLFKLFSVPVQKKWRPVKPAVKISINSYLGLQCSVWLTCHNRCYTRLTWYFSYMVTRLLYVYCP